MLKLTHLNVQGIINKLDALQVLMTEHDLMVMCLTETWSKDDSIDITNIPNYQLGAYYARTNHILQHM